MTFKEIMELLPNGLHDANLRGFTMDYVHQRLIFDLVVWIAEEDSPRELYRPARLTFDEVSFIFVELPRNFDQARVAGDIRIDAGEGIPRGVNCDPAQISELSSVTWIFLNDLNSFLIFSAVRGSLEWIGDAEIH